MNLTLQDRLNMITAKVEDNRRKKLAEQEAKEKQYRDMINEIVSYEHEIGEILTLAQELDKNSIAVNGTYSHLESSYNFLRNRGKRSLCIAIDPELYSVSLQITLDGKAYNLIVNSREIHTTKHFHNTTTTDEDVPSEVLGAFISFYPDFKNGFYKWFDNIMKIN